MEFREMRRKRQQLSDEESYAILQNATSGTLALLGDGGYPYAVPISYVFCEGKLYFHSALSGHKVDAIRSCDRASFCVVAQDDVKPAMYTTFFRSVIAFGRITIVEDPARTEKIARQIGLKYHPTVESVEYELANALSRVLCWELRVEHMTGKLVNEK